MLIACLGLDGREEGITGPRESQPSQPNILRGIVDAECVLPSGIQLWGHTENVKVFGKDALEANLFVKAAASSAHIAILDQHLEYGGESNILGSDLMRALVATGFRGLLCMRSGNVAAEDQQLYFEVRGLHVD